MRRKNSVLSLHKSCFVVSTLDRAFIESLNDSFLVRAPEMFDIIPKSVNTTTAKKNLAQIAKVLGQITSGTEFGDDKPSYIPINDFVRNAIGQLTSWFMQGMSSIPRCNILEFNLSCQLPMCLMPRDNSMRMNLWMPLSSRNRSIFHRMRFILRIPYLSNNKIIWLVECQLLAKHALTFHVGASSR